MLHGITNAAFKTLPNCSQMTIATNGAVESGTTVTITTTASHGFKAGQEVQVLNVPVSGYNGQFAIVSIPNGTTFTYTAASSGLASSGGGIAQNLPHEVVPSDATVVNLVRSPQLFGFGLIDNIPDSDILANAANAPGFGIPKGAANMVPDENAVTRPESSARSSTQLLCSSSMPTRNSTNWESQRVQGRSAQRACSIPTNICHRDWPTRPPVSPIPTARRTSTRSTSSR